MLKNVGISLANLSIGCVVNEAVSYCNCAAKLPRDLFRPKRHFGSFGCTLAGEGAHR